MKSKFLLLYFCLFLASKLFTQVKDADGKVYKIVKIGSQIWMAENLDVRHFTNGDSIPEARTEAEWISAGQNGKPAWCYYNNSKENGKKYGKLYNWFAVTDKRGIAPFGWKIPTSENAEYSIMKNFLGSKDFMARAAAKKIKATGYWKSNNGSNASGFTALPGGIRKDNGKFEMLKEFACWWCADEGLMLHQPNELPISGSDEFLYDNNTFFPSRRGSLVSCGMAVRCLKK